MELKPGDKVRYVDAHCNGQKGIVKSIHTDFALLGRIGYRSVFVVYHCGGNWDNFEGYTAALTKIDNLKAGW